MFQPEELEAVQQMLDHYHLTDIANGHQILTYDDGGRLAGLAYFAPREFADRVWELLMIAVDAGCHRQGIGSRLLLAVEEAVRVTNGRLLLIETSSRSDFAGARQFNRRHGYTDVAHIPDFFAEGDGKTSFVKRCGPSDPRPDRAAGGTETHGVNVSGAALAIRCGHP